MEICGIKAELLDPMSGSGCLNYLNRDFRFYMYVLAPFWAKIIAKIKRKLFKMATFDIRATRAIS